MNGNDVIKLGYPKGVVIGLALKAAQVAKAQKRSRKVILDELAQVLIAPDTYTSDSIYSAVAEALLKELKAKQIAAENAYLYEMGEGVPYKIWGKSGIEPGAIEQLKRAVRLPVAVRGALMPDAHTGYGLPIGGVLATDNSVIPYGVGVDIACRMKLTVFDAAPYILEQKKDKYRKILESKTCFGAGVEWETPQQHDVLDDPLWREHPIARQYRDIARRQLGTSGSGNHFVEFGELNVETEIVTPLGLIPPGRYLALLSHSGSRRLGLEVAQYYTHVAMQRHSALPKDYIHLAWLNLNESSGAEYWAAMQLAGQYASANHAVIHRLIAEALHFPILGGIENHHNFAWKETFEDKEVIVHRKGATPAGAGVLGVIPGSMSAPGYVVRGRGSVEALSSAAHGAGRRMSRSEAFKRFEWDVVKRKLKSEGVDLLSAGLDESPGAYKDIQQVMADQTDLVEVLAEFKPRMVKMDPSGKRGHGAEHD